MTGLSSYGETQVLTPLTTNGFVSLHTADPWPDRRERGFPAALTGGKGQ